MLFIYNEAKRNVVRACELYSTANHILHMLYFNVSSSRPFQNYELSS